VPDVYRRLAALLVILAPWPGAAIASAPSPAPVPRSPAAQPFDAPVSDTPEAVGSTFDCGEDRQLILDFVKGAEGRVSVDAGDGPYVLTPQPWLGGEPKITWSDGRRTLTWTVGVKLMWMDGSSHLACGRAQHHH